jgi:two-component system chemotaxis response regulator CheY
VSYRVLIVDDSQIIRGAVKKSILMSGLDISEAAEASNGQEALQVLATDWVDIVFADLNMPVMGGIELVERMSKDPALCNIPVVIVSSDQRQAMIDEMKGRGVKGYIKKPFRPENFRDVVQELLGAQSMGGKT